MNQSRRISPRIPYDEAVCVAREDGRGRLYTRGLDLSCTGVSVVCSETLPLGTKVRCTLLLPGGPRTVPGRVVRATALPRGMGLAISFESARPGVTASIAHLIEQQARAMQPAKLRVDGLERPLRCEGRIDDGTARLTASLPFLRLDGGVDVVLGEGGEVAAGFIRRIGLDPATADGIPRLAVEVALSRDGAESDAAVPEPLIDAGLTPPPTKLPPAFGHPLPSVVVSRTLELELRRAEERPPRRRVHGTAEIPRRAMLSIPAPVAVHHTDRLDTVGTSDGFDIRFWGFGVLMTFAAFAIASLLGRP